MCILLKKFAKKYKITSFSGDHDGISDSFGHEFDSSATKEFLLQQLTSEPIVSELN
jgi:hypothetical protein